MFSRWPLTFRGTGAALLAAACLVLAQRFALAELVYLAVLLVLLVAGSIATLYLVRRTERVTRSFDPAVVSVGDEVEVFVQSKFVNALRAVAANTDLDGFEVHEQAGRCQHHTKTRGQPRQRSGVGTDGGPAEVHSGEDQDQVQQ